MHVEERGKVAAVTLTLAHAIEQLNRLPMIPAVVAEVIASFNNPDLDVGALAAKIGLDHGLATKVLRVANSSFYGLTRQVGTIPSAVVVLGFGNIRAMIIAASMATRFPPVQGESFDRAAFWQHSMRTAVCARRIARLAKLDAEIAFTAGFLRDIGTLIVQHCQSLLAPASVEHASDLDIAVLGAEAARRWNFPDAIYQAIHAQSRPEASESPIGDVVSVADALARCRSNDIYAELETTVHPAVWARRTISAETVDACVADIAALQGDSALSGG